MGHEAKKQQHVIGPESYRLTIGQLPSANTSRWVPKRKAKVVVAVRGGLLTMEEACARYRPTD